MVESTTEVVGGLEAGDTGNSDDLFIGFPQHFPGALKAEVAQFLHGGTDKVLSEGFFYTAARHGNKFDDIGHADRKMGVVMNVSQGPGDPRMIDCQVVGAVTFNNAGRWNVTIAKGVAGHRAK